ncbi:hypothetical protein [Campylobacter sp. RM5063]|uniref:hypothetical protein n=1 Tax=Campylobacter sp. RM5063 TaxID=2735747 RepID=UPI002152837C|nr:hypothetical protein [Campylobacter lari]MCR6513010.1 hypothetical protein [Campylobacter lari]MCR8708808.1 hypothetical protein [Campylobacter sp. RM5063]
MANKEKRGIYNVSFNDKNSTPINTELEIIEEAIIDYVVHKDSNDARVYEWEKNNTRFRLVTDTNYKQVIKGEGHSNTPLSPSDEIIITFYSDRNLNKRMEFKNPKVKAYYEEKSLKQEKNSNYFKQKLESFSTKIKGIENER